MHTRRRDGYKPWQPTTRNERNYTFRLQRVFVLLFAAITRRSNLKPTKNKTTTELNRIMCCCCCLFICLFLVICHSGTFSEKKLLFNCTPRVNEFSSFQRLNFFRLFLICTDDVVDSWDLPHKKCINFLNFYKTIFSLTHTQTKA